MGDSLESVSGRVIHNVDYTSTHGANVGAFKMSACYSACHAVDDVCIYGSVVSVDASSDASDMFASFESSLVMGDGKTL